MQGDSCRSTTLRLPSTAARGAGPPAAATARKIDFFGDNQCLRPRSHVAAAATGVTRERGRGASRAGLAVCLLLGCFSPTLPTRSHWQVAQRFTCCCILLAQRRSAAASQPIQATASEPPPRR